MIYNNSTSLKINLNYKGKYFTFGAGERKILTSVLTEEQEQELSRRHANLIYIPNEKSKQMNNTINNINALHKPVEAPQDINKVETIVLATGSIEGDIKDADVINEPVINETIDLAEPPKKDVSEENYFKPVEKKPDEPVKIDIPEDVEEKKSFDEPKKKKAGRPKKS